MKKFVLMAGLLLAAGMTLYAQSGTGSNSVWSLQAQLGHNLSSGELDSGNLFSLGGGYQFTSNIRIGLDLATWEGNLQPPWLGSNRFWTAMIAPEYDIPIDSFNQLYVLAGLGFAHRGSKVLFVGPNEVFYQPGDTKWAGELGVGWRHFFNENWGLSVQGTYTHLDLLSADTVDGRVGVFYRF
ncbi:MAG: outer membrane beta-barrel protein [Acidobacteriota bacterium]